MAGALCRARTTAPAPRPAELGGRPAGPAPPAVQRRLVELNVAVAAEGRPAEAGGGPCSAPLPPRSRLQGVGGGGRRAPPPPPLLRLREGAGCGERGPPR